MLDLTNKKCQFCGKQAEGYSIAFACPICIDCLFDNPEVDKLCNDNGNISEQTINKSENKSVLKQKSFLD